MCAREWDWRNKIMRMSSLPRPPPNKKHMKLIINSRQFVTKRNVFPKLIKKHSLSSAPKLAGKLLFRQNNVGFDIYICKLLTMFTKCCERLPQIRTQIGFGGHDAVLSFCNVFFFYPRSAIYMAESGIHLFNLISDLEISNSLWKNVSAFGRFGSGSSNVISSALIT